MSGPTERALPYEACSIDTRSRYAAGVLVGWDTACVEAEGRAGLVDIPGTEGNLGQEHTFRDVGLGVVEGAASTYRRVLRGRFRSLEEEDPMRAVSCQQRCYMDSITAMQRCLPDTLAPAAVEEGMRLWVVPTGEEDTVPVYLDRPTLEAVKERTRTVLLVLLLIGGNALFS